MIVLLYGPDSYRRDARKKEILDELRAEKQWEFGSFDSEDDSSLAALAGFLGTPSLFRGKRLAILHDAVLEEKWEKVLETVLKSTDAEILLTTNKKPRKEFSFLLKKPVQCEVFEFLDGNEWESFIKKEAAARGISLGSGTLRALADEYAKNTWGLVTELEKLRGLGKRTIETRDILLAGGTREDFWSITGRLLGSQRGARLMALEEMLAYEDPAKIFYILASRLRGREDAVAHADVAIKSGKVDFEEALLGLLL